MKINKMNKIGFAFIGRIIVVIVSVFSIASIAKAQPCLELAEGFHSSEHHQAKHLEVLFLIDNSKSMTEHQKALATKAKEICPVSKLFRAEITLEINIS